MAVMEYSCEVRLAITTRVLKLLTCAAVGITTCEAGRAYPSAFTSRAETDVSARASVPRCINRAQQAMRCFMALSCVYSTDPLRLESNGFNGQSVPEGSSGRSSLSARPVSIVAVINGRQGGRLSLRLYADRTAAGCFSGTRKPTLVRPAADSTWSRPCSP